MTVNMAKILKNVNNAFLRRSSGCLSVALAGNPTGRNALLLLNTFFIFSPYLTVLLKVKSNIYHSWLLGFLWFCNDSGADYIWTGTRRYRGGGGGGGRGATPPIIQKFKTLVKVGQNGKHLPKIEGQSW